MELEVLENLQAPGYPPRAAGEPKIPFEAEGPRTMAAKMPFTAR